MTVRLYWSPNIGDGSQEDGFRPSALDKPTEKMVYQVPIRGKYTLLGDVRADGGHPRHTHSLCAVKAADWTAFEADALEILLLPDIGLNNGAELRMALVTRTAGDVPAAFRSRWIDMISEIGGDISGITVATPMLRVLRQVLALIDVGSANDQGFVNV